MSSQPLNPIGKLVTPDAMQLGDIMIVLPPPDYHSPIDVQKHLIFSTIFGWAVANEFESAHGASCRVFITTDLFPNMSAFMMSTVISSDRAKLRNYCLNALIATIQKTPLSATSVKAGQTFMHLYVKHTWTVPDIQGKVSPKALMRAALRRIYQSGDILHSLLSVSPDILKRETDTDEPFLRWVEGIRKGKGLTAKELPTNAFADRRPPPRVLSRNPAQQDVQEIEVVLEEGAGRIFLLVPLGNSAPSIVREIVKRYCTQRDANDRDVKILPMSVFDVKCIAENYFGLERWLGMYVEWVDLLNWSGALDILRHTAGDLKGRMGNRLWFQDSSKRMYIVMFPPKG